VQWASNTCTHFPQHFPIYLPLCSSMPLSPDHQKGTAPERSHWCTRCLVVALHICIHKKCNTPPFISIHHWNTDPMYGCQIGTKYPVLQGNRAMCFRMGPFAFSDTLLRLVYMHRVVHHQFLGTAAAQASAEPTKRWPWPWQLMVPPPPTGRLHGAGASATAARIAVAVPPIPASCERQLGACLACRHFAGW
jgi:hypothetical protein